MKFIVSTVLVLGLTAATFAQSPSKVLKQAEKALGGRKALQSVMSVVKRGTITRISDGAVGQYVMRTSKPNLFYERNAIGTTEFEGAFNGRSGWSRSTLEAEEDGLWTHTGKVASDGVATAAFRNNLWLNAKTDKVKITSGGKTSIAGRVTNLLLMTSAKGVQIKLYFDAETDLLVRDETPGGDEIDITDYDDYRNVGGIMQPFFVRLTSVGIAYEIRFEEIKINQPIARSEFDFPVVSNEPLPDIQALLNEIQANQDKLEAMLERYSYTQKITERKLGKDGVLREKGSETFQLSFYKGNRVRRLIEKNGQPLSVKDQADADKDAAKQVEEIDKKSAREESRLANTASSGAQSQDTRRVSIAELLRASKLTNPRRERFRGRDVVVFDFEPNPAFDMKNAKSILKYFGKTAGVIWIDEKDKQVARLEAVLFESIKIGGGVLAKLKKGASFTVEQERVFDEIWLPSQTDIDLSVRVFLVKGMEINQVIRSYDYRKFETEVKDAKVGEDKNP